MALLPGSALTLVDWAKRTDADGKIAMIAELLSQSNEILDDMLFVEGNLPTGHKTTIRTGLPAATWRLLNYGVQPSKSTTAPIVDTCGNLEAYAQVDKDIVDLNGNTAAFRLSETRAFYESLTQIVASTLMYGNAAVNPERFHGFAPRYNTVLTANNALAANVIDAGGTGSNNTSIWMVVWGSDTVHGIFPKGKKAGLDHKDLGEITAINPDGSMYQVYRDHFKWEIGLTVRDWRYIVRIANIDVPALINGGGANLLNALTRAVNRLPTTGGASAVTRSDAPSISGSMGKCVIYCNREVRTALELQTLNKTNMLLKMDEVDGKPFLSWRGLPIRTVDALLNTEARVV